MKACLKLRAGTRPEGLPSEAIFAHCEERLAKFKIPRYVAYVDDFPRTPSRKIQKKALIANVPDLRIDAYDRQDECWR